MSGFAERYAKVLYDVAEERQVTQGVEEGLDYLVEMLDKVEEFRSIWMHPVLGSELKMEILDPVLDVEPLVRDFAALLVDRGREKGLRDIRAAFADLRLSARGVTRVEVHSASELDDDARRELGEALSQLGYEEVVVDEHRDPSLLGGLMVRIGDTKIDGSLRRRLARIEEVLSREV